MKSRNYAFLLVIALLPLLSFKSKPVADDGYYAIIVVDGVWKDKVGYASRVIYFPGYTDCNKNRDIDFFANAKRSFSNHLKANFSGAFPYGENNNFQVISKVKNSTSTLLKSRSEAERRLSEWAADQKAQGYNVQHTSFGFTCK